MAFSSVPLYLDPPNWQQQGNQHQLGVANENPSQLSSAMSPPPGAGGSGGDGIGSIRPGSMTDRARLAKIVTQPDTALKCPRCESTNTKFCYFNNYSLSQPRHFCKTCRRYWTRGGALRNVPVGGGCRRNNNKRTKRSRSKSPVRSGEERRNGPINTSNDVISNILPPRQTHNLSFLTSTTPFHNFSHDFSSSTQNGLNFGGNDQMEVQMSLSSRFADQFRFQQMQQFPFFAALEQPSTNLYQFEAVEYDVGATDHHINIGSKSFESGNVKMEDDKSNSQGLNLPRNNLGVKNDRFFPTNHNAWCDISGFTSSSPKP